MSERFKPGDLAIMQNGTYYAEFDGCPAVVVGGLDYRLSVNLITMKNVFAWTYRVRLLTSSYTWPRANIVSAYPYQLRRPDNKQEIQIEIEEILMEQE